LMMHVTVVQTFDIPYELLWTADPKPGSLEQMLFMEVKPGAHFDTMKELIERAGKCRVTNVTVHLPPATDANQPDILIIGFCCQPWTAMRANRFEEGNPQQHPLFDTTHETIELLHGSRAKAAICEQVGGFNMKSRNDNLPGTPADRFVEKVQARNTYAVKVLKYSGEHWNKIPRVRFLNPPDMQRTCGQHTRHHSYPRADCKCVCPLSNTTRPNTPRATICARWLPYTHGRCSEPNGEPVWIAIHIKRAKISTYYMLKSAHKTS